MVAGTLVVCSMYSLLKRLLCYEKQNVSARLQVCIFQNLQELTMPRNEAVGGSVVLGVPVGVEFKTREVEETRKGVKLVVQRPDAT